MNKKTAQPTDKSYLSVVVCGTGRNERPGGIAGNNPSLPEDLDYSGSDTLNPCASQQEIIWRSLPVNNSTSDMLASPPLVIRLSAEHF